jgi:hypothetical protein
LSPKRIRGIINKSSHCGEKNLVREKMIIGWHQPLIMRKEDIRLKG